MSEQPTAISWQRDEHIFVPIDEKRFAIRDIDWQRCKRKMENIRLPTRRNSIIYSALLGVFASTSINYISIFNSSDIIPLVKALNICVIIFSAIGSYAVYKIDEDNRTKFNKDIDEIVTDMSEIESTFVSPTIEE